MFELTVLFILYVDIFFLNLFFSFLVFFRRTAFEYSGTSFRDELGFENLDDIFTTKTFDKKQQQQQFNNTQKQKLQQKQQNQNNNNTKKKSAGKTIIQANIFSELIF